MTCPVCQELTPTDLCSKCRAKPQMSAVTLMNRMRGWERTHQHLSEVSYDVMRVTFNLCDLQQPLLYFADLLQLQWVT